MSSQEVLTLRLHGDTVFLHTQRERARGMETEREERKEAESKSESPSKPDHPFLHPGHSSPSGCYQKSVLWHRQAESLLTVLQPLYSTGWISCAQWLWLIGRLIDWLIDCSPGSLTWSWVMTLGWTSRYLGAVQRALTGRGREHSFCASCSRHFLWISLSRRTFSLPKSRTADSTQEVRNGQQRRRTEGLVSTDWKRNFSFPCSWSNIVD